MTMRVVNFTCLDDLNILEIVDEHFVNQESEPQPIIITGSVQTTVIIGANAAVIW